MTEVIFKRSLKIMTAQVKVTVAGFISLLAILLFSFAAIAAAPDGSGPWADAVESSSQGLRKDGSAVPAIRSDATSALGVAENNTTDGNFFSLGFGGNIVLSFDNGISSGTIEVVETTALPYPTEKAKVEVSEDGVAWINAGNVNQDGSVAVPQGLDCVLYVRVTDISDAEDFSDNIADGFDVDGVKLIGEACSEVTPTVTPTATPTVTPTVTPTPTSGPCDCAICGSVTQSNKTIVSTNVFSSSNTGGNKIKGNVGGTNTITTGNSSTTTTVSVTGGTNINNAAQCSCSGSANLTISGNGAGSKNKILIKSGSFKKN